MYICLNCINDALPFQQLQNAEFHKLFYDYSKITLRKEFDSINKDLSLEELITAEYKYRNVQWLKSHLLLSKKQNQLSVLHLNIRSIAKNKNILEECLRELHCCPDILAVSETKLNKNNVNLASIENYSIVYSNSSSNAGGVVIYILNNLKFTRREDLEFNSSDSENVLVEITLHSKKVIIFGLIYRHPRNFFSEFQDKFLQTIIKLGQDKLDYLICGDFNIDLLKREV